MPLFRPCTKSVALKIKTREKKKKFSLAVLPRRRLGEKKRGVDRRYFGRGDWAARKRPNADVAKRAPTRRLHWPFFFVSGKKTLRRSFLYPIGK